MNPNLRNLQALQGGRMPQGPDQREMELRQARLQTNPIANDTTMLPTLRGLHGCPIGQEQKQVSALVSKMVETRDEKFLDIIGQTVLETLKAEFECPSHFEDRTVARLEEDADISSMLSKMREVDKKITELQAELDEHAKNQHTMAGSIWQAVVKTYGLIPDQRSYTLDDDTGVVKQVSINCDKCNARRVIPEMRRKMAQCLMDRINEEKPDAGRVEQK